MNGYAKRWITSSQRVNFGISDSSGSQKVLFFTAKIDERGRIIVPAAIRKKLGICFSSCVFVGVEKVSGSAVDVPEK